MFDYPEHQDFRSGCKVSWRIYDKRDDAEEASKVAAKEARRQASLGYDFGYCSPGSIDTLRDGRFEVCCP